MIIINIMLVDPSFVGTTIEGCRRFINIIIRNGSGYKKREIFLIGLCTSTANLQLISKVLDMTLLRDVIHSILENCVEKLSL